MYAYYKGVIHPTFGDMPGTSHLKIVILGHLAWLLYNYIWCLDLSVRTQLLVPYMQNWCRGIVNMGMVKE